MNGIDFNDDNKIEIVVDIINDLMLSCHLIFYIYWKSQT